jgi:ribosomal protein S18 acetylase RimI-like enzyme
LSDYTIRPADRTDEPFLWEMLYHALYITERQAPFPRAIVNQPDIRKYVDGWGKAGDQGFLAIDKLTSQPVGAAWSRLFTSENQGYGYVREDIPELSIVVLSSYRNQGIGTRPLDSMIDSARGQYPALSLSVSINNPAVRLYERFGFQPVYQREGSITLLKWLHPCG